MSGRDDPTIAPRITSTALTGMGFRSGAAGLGSVAHLDHCPVSTNSLRELRDVDFRAIHFTRGANSIAIFQGALERSVSNLGLTRPERI